MKILVVTVVALSAVVYGQNSTEPAQFECTSANGTAPDGTDDTCQRFWLCEDYNLTLWSCPEGQAYSWYNGSCVNASRVPCFDQNEAFNETITNRTAAVRQKRAAPSPETPASNNGTSTEQPISDLPPVVVKLGTRACKRLGANVHAAERVANNALHLFSHCIFNRCDIEPLRFECP